MIPQDRLWNLLLFLILGENETVDLLGFMAVYGRKVPVDQECDKQPEQCRVKKTADGKRRPVQQEACNQDNGIFQGIKCDLICFFRLERDAVTYGGYKLD